PLTSPIPPSFFTSPPPKSAQLPTKSTLTPAQVNIFRRPSNTVFASGPPALKSSSPHKTGPRDRRAYSFPTPRSPGPESGDVFGKSGRKVDVMPRFSRKTHSVAMASNPSPFLGSNAKSTPVRKAQQMDRSTGGNNTPLTLNDSAFCSTSESSEEHDACAVESGHSVSPIKSQPIASFLPRGVLSTGFDTLRANPSASRSTSYTAQLPTRASQSPVAALMAASGSSRSREDILSWAKAVGMRERSGRTEREDDEGEARGRTRARRGDGLNGITPPSEENIDDPVLGATPKGNLGQLMGLTVGPIVKALKGVTLSNTVPAVPGLAARPAPVEVTKTTVIVDDVPSSSHFYFGATPTMSTISFSEVVDPSVGDNPEQIDVVNDDQSAASSSAFQRRHSVTGPKSKAPAARPSPPMPQPPQRQLLPNIPRPITSTATAIWNLSTFLGSFAPFSISSALASPQTQPLAALPAAMPSPMKPPSRPLPAAAHEEMPMADEDGLASGLGFHHDHDHVRSLPMDIISMGARSVAGKEVRERGGTSRSQSRARKRTDISRSPSVAGQGEVVIPEAEVEEDERRRGRGRSRRRRSSVSREGKAVV
ncbi:hypothetical protein P7C73_g2082, partial [Tremellales sp. Uapishka_1]